MRIGGVDVNVTKLWQKRERKKSAEDTRKTKEIERVERVRNNNRIISEDFLVHEVHSTESDNNINEDSQVDPDYVDSVKSPTSQNRITLTHYSAECDRYKISDRAAAALANALLQDHGIICEKILI